MRTDFDNLQDGDRVTLFPNNANPLHKRATAATYSSGYFYCDGSSQTDGPDYYLGDVLAYNDGFEVIASEHGK